jgi:hypothetical protein
MKSKKSVERALAEELQQILPNIIAPDSQGGYQLFGRYRLVSNAQEHQVFCNNNAAGVFGTTRAAVSWCIADRYQQYRLARDIEVTDRALNRISSDVHVRSTVAQRSRSGEFHESVQAKLETKLIRKQQLENHLQVCVNLAKYIQQRGFDNETARTGPSKTNRANRSST